MNIENARNAMIFVVIVAVAISGKLNATVIIAGGTASAGTDFGCSPNQANRPSDFSLNVFYDEADLTTRPSGSLSAHGWATTSWNIAGGDSARINANGSSIEGFNGSLCTPPGGGTGWLYGRGHSDFSVTITLDHAYHYSSSASGTLVSGISNGFGAGILGAGTHTISGHSIGNSGYSLDVALCPELFDNATIQWGPLPDNSGMAASFTPNLRTPGILLSDLAGRCGYDHFAWHQVVLEDPFNLVLDPPQLIVPYIDPPLFPSRGASFFNGEYLDAAPFYWNEEQPRQTLSYVHLSDHTLLNRSVEFEDSPSRPFLAGNTNIRFKTRLAGVRANGKWDELFAFTWAVTYSGITSNLSGENELGTVTEYEVAPIGVIEAGESQLITDCANCIVFFSDGFESGDLSAWAF